MAIIVEIFSNKIVQIFLTIIIIASYLMALRSVKKASAKNFLIQKTILTKKTVWDEHPQRKVYFFLRTLFHIGIALCVLLKIGEIFFKMPISNIHSVNLLFLVPIFFILLIVKCPRCKASLFLQEVNSEFMRLPKVCLKCGYPTNDLSQADSQVAIRPAFKIAFLVFMVIPVLLIIVTLFYLFLTGQMH